MTDQDQDSQNQHSNPDQAASDASETLIVPPPGFRERLLAAQRARELQARRATQFKPATPADESTSPAASASPTDGAR